MKAFHYLCYHGMFDAFPVSLTLPPSSAQLLLLSGMPLSVGTLAIWGCILKCFGMITEHLFEDFGEETVARGPALVDPFKNSHGVHHAALYNKIEVVQPLPLLVAQVGGVKELLFGMKVKSRKCKSVCLMLVRFQLWRLT